MRLNQTEIRIQKLAGKGLTAPDIARRLGWGDSAEAIAKVRDALTKPSYLYGGK